MATRKRPGLDDVQLSTLRAQLADGKSPRVAITGPQFPDGTSGTIVRIGDPITDGTEFITVRVKIDRVVDELQFAPAELTSNVPGAKVEKAAAPSPAKRVRPAARPAVAAVAPRSSVTSAPRPPAKQAAPTTARPAARRKPAPGKPVSITITSSGSDWTFSAHRGAKSLVKNLAVTPGTVSALAKLIGNPELSEAVADINDAARAEAEDRAAKLRAELSAVEAVLAAHKTPR